MSADGYLKFEDGQVKLGDVLLPGILVQQSVRCGVRYDESKHDSMSGKKKAILGWEDSTINLTLDLLCDEDSDCYAKLATINRIFKAADKGKAAPKIYPVSDRHLRARGISRVVFDCLDSFETDQEDVIQVTLTFVEHLPPVIKREKRAIARKSAVTQGKAAAPAVKATPAKSPAITKDTTNPFMAGFNKGNK
jgi:hypothetical protein